MEQLKLSNQLCFKVYALSRQITAVYKPMLEKLGLTYPQYLVMLVLWEKSPLSVKELGEFLLLDSGTLTPLLKRMEEMNLLTRTRSSVDERVVLIQLTPTGTRLQEKAVTIPSELAACMGLELEEFQQYARLSDKLLKSVSEHIQ